MRYKINSLNRPISPHLSIYNPQITSLASIWHRITGVLLIAIIVFINIIIKYSLNYYNIVTIISLKLNVMYFIHLVILFIFSYHSLNGIRHILWDLGYILKRKNLVYSFYILSTFIFCILIFNII
nr:succinate dehydrogenase subunit 3 [Hypnea sp.]